MTYIQGDPRDFFKLRFLGQFLQGHNGFIAGGCFKDILAGQKTKDIDIFFLDRRDWQEAVEHFDALTQTQYNDPPDPFPIEPKFEKHYENDNVTAYRSLQSGVTVELIQKTTGPVNRILDTFDFTVTKFAYYAETVLDEEGEAVVHHKLKYHPQFFEHLYMKRLVIDSDDGLAYPVATFHRVLRYAKYGFQPCRETRAKLMRAIHGLPPTEVANADFGTLYDGVD